MKSFLVCLLALLISPAFAADEEKPNRFYQKQIDESWYVGGNQYTGKHNSTCFAHVDFKDGSNFEITRDLVDGELYLRVENLNWSLAKGTDDELKLRINLYRGNTVIDGNTFGWVIISKNVIVIPEIGIKGFMDALWKSDTIRIIMPGDTGNANIYVGKSRAVINSLAECIKKFGKDDKAPDLSGAPAANPATSKKDKGGI